MCKPSILYDLCARSAPFVRIALHRKIIRLKVRYTSSLLRYVPDTYVTVVAVHETLPCSILALVVRCKSRTGFPAFFHEECANKK